MKPAATLTAMILLGGCNGFSLLPETPEATLADLPPARINDAQEVLPRVGLTEVARNYRAVLALSDDRQTRLTVQHRLADISLLDGEASMAGASRDTGHFDDAIEAYEALLRDNPDNPDNDELLYQLAKAYDFSGDSARSLALLERLSSSYPQSAHLLEAEFRKAESYFSAGDYRAAEVAYAGVINYGSASPFYTNALYMQGWSLFKQGHYQQAIGPFLATLDQLVPADNQPDQLPRGEAELVQDCLRVLAVVFSELEGADSIAAANTRLGERPYQHLLYQQLGDRYLGQERYADSAATYRAYTERFPDSKVAHQMQLRVIASYEAGGFTQLIVQEKQQYVALFGIGGSYWEHSSEDARAAMAARLKVFVGQLAGHYHALAQQAAGDDGQRDLAVQHYQRAGDYYQLYIDSFPGDETVPTMGFLLAESRYEAGDYARAAATYEWVAYQHSDNPRAADAGYAALLAWQHTAGGEDAAPPPRAHIDSALRFAAVFPGDTRAPAVLGHAADALAQSGDYPGAIDAAASLMRWQPAPEDAVRLSARLVTGYSYFELQQYQASEQAYLESLALMPGDDERRAATTERLAASIYCQAEQAVAGEQYGLAAAEFARVTVAAPGSDISVNALYDAASNYQRAGDLAEANRLLLDFRQRYPDHALNTSIAPTLAGNYEALGQWQAAAAELERIADTGTDDESRRQALYLAAQYYDKAGEQALALARYRDYAERWPRPPAIRMEAMDRLAQLNALAGEPALQRHWLQQIIAAHAANSTTENDTQPSGRSRYLAASSSSQLAASEYETFSAIRLGYPLKASLRDKKAAMQRTLAAYEQTGEYGVEQFSTLASYQMGQVYLQLSADLMASERPANIDPLALEQYELMLEEQAYPFEEKAIAIHESNARRCREGIYDEWVRRSFGELARLLPARYGKTETVSGDDIVHSEQWFEEHISRNPDDLANLNEYGVLLRLQGRFPEAEQSYLAALAVAETYPDTHRNIAVLYDLYLGDSEQALQHLYRYQALTNSDDRTVAGWIADLERQVTMLVQEN